MWIGTVNGVLLVLGRILFLVDYNIDTKVVVTPMYANMPKGNVQVAINSVDQLLLAEYPVSCLKYYQKLYDIANLSMSIWYAIDVKIHHSTKSGLESFHSIIICQQWSIWWEKCIGKIIN